MPGTRVSPGSYIHGCSGRLLPRGSFSATAVAFEARCRVCGKRPPLAGAFVYLILSFYCILFYVIFPFFFSSASFELLFLSYMAGPLTSLRVLSSIHPTCRPIANAAAIHPTAKCYMHFMLRALNPSKGTSDMVFPQAGTRSHLGSNCTAVV